MKFQNNSMMQKKFECPDELNLNIKKASDFHRLSDREYLIVAIESFLRLSLADQSLEIAKSFELRANSLRESDKVSQ